MAWSRTAHRTNAKIATSSGNDLFDSAVVFENAFWPGGVRSMVYAELGEVSVSEDGETWLSFPCDHEGDGEGGFAG